MMNISFRHRSKMGRVILLWMAISMASHSTYALRCWQCDTNSQQSPPCLRDHPGMPPSEVMGKPWAGHGFCGQGHVCVSLYRSKDDPQPVRRACARARPGMSDGCQDNPYVGGVPFKGFGCFCKEDLCNYRKGDQLPKEVDSSPSWRFPNSSDTSNPAIDGQPGSSSPADQSSVDPISEPVQTTNLRNVAQERTGNATTTGSKLGGRSEEYDYEEEDQSGDGPPLDGGEDQLETRGFFGSLSPVPVRSGGFTVKSNCYNVIVSLVLASLAASQIVSF